MTMKFRWSPKSKSQNEMLLQNTTMIMKSWRNSYQPSVATATLRLFSSSPRASSAPVNSHSTPFLIYDTAKGSKCQLTTRKRNILTWYSCGPTVYDSAHIGHASSFVRQDVIRRIMESLDKDTTVIQVMGITDIDDKIINKANQSGKEWNAISKQYEQEFVEDLHNLNVMQPHLFTRVSDHIPQIIQFVGSLVSSGYAYPTPDGSVYFDSGKYGNRYGKLRQFVAAEEEGELGAEAEDDISKDKKNIRDFALWKGAKPGEPFWESPWGSRKGRPGWHIECSVMASNIFGPNLDLHSGGQDLIFPHHENEEAQCCAHFDSSQWTSHWIHTGHLHFKGDVKMSKSLGNTVSIGSFLSEHSPDLLRMMCIISKYRSDLEYSPDSIDIARKMTKKFSNFLSDVVAILSGSKIVTITAPDNESFWTKLEMAKSKLRTALMNDFDTSEALKILIEFISDFNRHFVPLDSKNISSTSVNFELVLSSKIFVQEFLNLVGLTGYVAREGKSSSSPSHDDVSNANLESVLNQFVHFRNDVRSYSLAFDESDKVLRKQRIGERKQLLKFCDNARNQLLSESNVEVKDHGKTSSWSFVEPSAENKIKIAK